MATMRYPDPAFLEQTVQRMIRARAVHGAILRVEDGPGTLQWAGAAGNLQAEQPYFIASVTKMYLNLPWPEGRGFQPECRASLPTPPR